MSSKLVKKGPLAGKLGGANYFGHGDDQTTFSESKPVTVVWKGMPSEDTFLFGSWDSWENGRPVTERDNSDEHDVVLELAPGRYEFKYKSSSGVWFHDPAKPTTVNAFGTLNNVLDVPGTLNNVLDVPGTLNNVLDVPGAPNVSFTEAQRVYATCIAFRGEVEERLINGRFARYVPVFYQAQVVAGMNYKIVVNVGKNNEGEDILVIMEVFWGLGNATPELTCAGFYKEDSEQNATK
ncbi:uncharacterized protein LOC144919103 isoform X2 [Branchiostoma floridae x Branchiostoma belcheri]